MHGYIAIILHAHLPFVRHPEYERCLEEHWLFGAITECYLPLVQVVRGWVRDGIRARLTISISPTLCVMLRDPLLLARYEHYLAWLIELAHKEIHRTRLVPELHWLAKFYKDRLQTLHATYIECERDIIAEFRRLRDEGMIEIVTTAATHAVLPLFARHTPSLRAQVLIARDCYRQFFGAEPVGFWLPECAYAPEIDPVLREANIRWTVLDTHGLLNAQPQPQYGIFAPVFTPAGIAVFGRDSESARQVWSRHSGYPGDPRYRDYYRDIGFDLDLEYLAPYLPTPTSRSATGIKYHAITGKNVTKHCYDPQAASRAIDDHVSEFVNARLQQIKTAAAVLSRPPIIVMPFDAELFGHWWFEGPTFLDRSVRKLALYQDVVTLLTPTDYLRANSTCQVVQPALSSWGKEGYLSPWLNEKTAWIYPHLNTAQNRMSKLAAHFIRANTIIGQALNQAARELLLAQSSDWPFMIYTGANQEYAIRRLTVHLKNHSQLCAQLDSGNIDISFLGSLEKQAGTFGPVDYTYFAQRS